MTAEPSDGIVVRPIAPEDHDRVRDITLTAYLQISGVAEDGEYLEELGDVAGRAALVPMLVAIDGASGTILGGVTYVPGPGPFAEQEQPDEAGFRMLAVSPDAQGRGVGRALVEACVALARHDGKRRIVLLTMPAMAAAHRLYERLGFDRQPDRDWEYEPGRWLWSYTLDL